MGRGAQLVVATRRRLAQLAAARLWYAQRSRGQPPSERAPMRGRLLEHARDARAIVLVVRRLAALSVASDPVLPRRVIAAKPSFGVARRGL